MKIKLAAMSLLVFLGLSASTEAYPVEHPAIGEYIAEARVYRVLREYPGWRYRQVGYVDCRHGRINSYTWACRVGWANYGHCRQGRIRITNVYSENETVYYNVNSVIRRC